MTPDPTKVCGECEHWTINPHTYGGGHCDLPAEPIMLIATVPTFFSWPATYEIDLCDQFQQADAPKEPS